MAGGTCSDNGVALLLELNVHSTPCCDTAPRASSSLARTHHRLLFELTQIYLSVVERAEIRMPRIWRPLWPFYGPTTPCQIIAPNTRFGSLQLMIQIDY